MPALQEQNKYRVGRGAMIADFSLVAASCAATIAAVRYNGKSEEADSAHEMPTDLLNVPARGHHDQAAGHA
ncbi:MAG: hypothetical protein ACHQIK_07930 [Candidatus Acidiferrales bacterium]